MVHFFKISSKSLKDSSISFSTVDPTGIPNGQGRIGPLRI